jgi:oligopeptide transport system permease protein
VVEQIFLVPGIGRHFVMGALNGDHPLVLGLVMLYSVLLVLFNLAADLVHGFIDPRVRH